MKRRVWILIALVTVFIIGGGIAAYQIVKANREPLARLTPDEVISRVKVYGLTDIYAHSLGQLKDAYPIGQWAAVYEGHNRWRITVSTCFRFLGEQRTQTHPICHSRESGNPQPSCHMDSVSSTE